MKLSLEQLSARMRQGETIPSRQTAPRTARTARSGETSPV